MKIAYIILFSVFSFAGIGALEMVVLPGNYDYYGIDHHSEKQSENEKSDSHEDES